MERPLHFFHRFRNLAPLTLWKRDWCWFNSGAVSSSRCQTAGFCVVSTRSAPQRLLGLHFAPMETLVGNAEGQERTGQARRMFFLAGSQPFPNISGFCCSSVRSRSSSSRARRTPPPRSNSFLPPQDAHLKKESENIWLFIPGRTEVTFSRRGNPTRPAARHLTVGGGKVVPCEEWKWSLGKTDLHVYFTPPPSLNLPTGSRPPSGPGEEPQRPEETRCSGSSVSANHKSP